MDFLKACLVKFLLLETGKNRFGQVFQKMRLSGKILEYFMELTGGKERNKTSSGDFSFLQSRATDGGSQACVQISKY